MGGEVLGFVWPIFNQFRFDQVQATDSPFSEATIAMESPASIGKAYLRLKSRLTPKRDSVGTIL